MVTAFLFSLSRILASFIREKEMKFRELTKIMGIYDSTIIISWYITYGLINAVSAVIMAGLSTINLFAIAPFGILFVFFYLSL